MGNATISEKQLACLHWAALGKTSWETAAILGLSERTVNFHIDSVCRTLRVNGRQAAITILFIAGLLPAAGEPLPAIARKITVRPAGPDPLSGQTETQKIASPITPPKNTGISSAQTKQANNDDLAQSG